MARVRRAALGLGIRAVTARASVPLSLVLLFLVAALCAGCAAGGPPAIERIEPSRGLNDRPLAITLLGRNLDPALRDGEERPVVESWQGTIGDRLLESIVFVAPERLTAVVPAGLSAGSHDLVLRTAGREVRVHGVFTSVEPIAPRIDRAEPAHISPLGGTTVRLSGIGLYAGSVVHLGDAGSPRPEASVPTRWIDDETLELVAPARMPGPVRLEVATPIGRAWHEDLLTYSDR